MRIASPKLFSKLNLVMLVDIIIMVLRTVLSVKIAEVNGNLVQSLIIRDKKRFLRTMLFVLGLAIPASILNSLLAYI